MNAQGNQHVTPYQAFGDQDANAMDQLGASIAATRREPQQQQAQPVQPMHQGQQPVVPMAQPPMQQPQQQQAVAPVTAAPEPQVGHPDMQGAVTNPVQQQQAVTPAPEPYKAPVIDVVEGDTSGAGELGGAPIVPDAPKPFEEAPKSELEFDQALAALEKELGISIDPEPEEPASEPGTIEPEVDNNKKSLEREGKFIKIINELDSTNRKSLKKVGELEVEKDNASTQLEYYKQQAQQYYEELRANEFDRSKFVVDDKAKNFVHYFNEYSADENNVQAKNSALREAIKIAGNITGRDLTPYLMDYFSQGASAGLGEIKGGAGVPKSMNVTPGRTGNADMHKRDILGSALSQM